MELGFACFEGFEDALHQDEGFPSALYQMWNAKQLSRINIRLSHFASDPKDSLMPVSLPRLCGSTSRGAGWASGVVIAWG